MKRTQIDLNTGWSFFRPEENMIPFDAMHPSFDDSDWRKVDLPHDWGVEGEYDHEAPGGNRTGFLPTGEGAYRQYLEVEPGDLEGRVWIYFEGAFRHSDVSVNGRHMGHRANGWVAFRYDITDALHPGRNLIAVRVDNRRQPASRWYTGSGINRPVSVLKVPNEHLDADRVAVEQHHAHHQDGRVRLDIDAPVLDSGRGLSSGMTLQHRLLAPDGNVVAEVTGEVGSTLSIEVDAPELWSPDSPVLYNLCSELLHGGVVVDSVETRIGLRSIELNATEGFVLNGERIKLKGFCIKEDHGPLGSALPDKLWRHKLMQLKASGSNAIRCGHYPFSRIFYHLCDELGILVMDEVCDGWDKEKADQDYGRDWYGNWQRDFEDTIRLHRNHPCIVFWSIGNEVHRQTDEKTQVLVDFVKAIDTSRLVVMGRGYPDSLDATCFNGQAEKPDVLEGIHKALPDRPIVLTETPHSYSTRGIYRTRTWLRDPGVPRFDIPNLTDEEVFFYGSNRNFSSYDNATIRIGIRECWKRTATMDFVAGQFHWTYWDYAGESEYHGTNAGDEPDGRFWPRGVVDMAMIRKDHSYYYESQFSDRPMVHLLPHWTHPRVAEGTVIPVWAYTNGDEAELFLDGTSLGRQQVPAYGNAAWDVPWQPGALEVVAYREGKEIARDIRQTAKAPTRLALLPDDSQLEAEAGDLTRVEIQALDASGTCVPWVSNEVALHIEGEHRFYGAENGDRLDFTALRSRSRRLYFGKMSAFIGTETAEGDIALIAAAIMGERYFTESTEVSLAVEQIALRGTSPEAPLTATYTIDGSQPTPDSPHLEQPLTLQGDTTVRVVIYREGSAILQMEEPFQLGEAPVQAIPPGHNPDDDQTIDGVRDPEAVGLWKSATSNDTYDFLPNGDVIQLYAKGIQDRVARWWYDYPNDRDEDPNDHGTGEWVKGKGDKIPLALTSRDADRMIVGKGDKAWSLIRIDAPSK